MMHVFDAAFDFSTYQDKDHMSFNKSQVEALGSGPASIAMGILSMQMDILQTFLPLESWLVGRMEAGHIDVVATFGNIDARAACALLDFDVNHGSSPVDAHGFRHRFVHSTRPEKPSPAHISGWQPRHMATALLPQCNRETSGIVAGFGSQPLSAEFSCASRTREIALCLKAIAQILTLRGEVAAVERRVAQTERDAQIDALTNILNRAGWDKRLRKAVDADADVAIGLLDLDFLKSINDNEGHLAGDELLNLTAQTIKTVLRSSDCVARLGGDEFAVMLHDATSADAAALKARIKWALGNANIKASIGVALKSEAGSLHTALRLADARMYEEKRTKRHGCPPPRTKAPLLHFADSPLSP